MMGGLSILQADSWPAFLTTDRSETVQGCGMIDFCDRGPRRHSQYYVEQPDQVKVKQGVPLGRRSRTVTRNAG